MNEQDRVCKLCGRDISKGRTCGACKKRSQRLKHSDKRKCVNCGGRVSEASELCHKCWSTMASKVRKDLIESDKRFLVDGQHGIPARYRQ